MSSKGGQNPGKTGGQAYGIGKGPERSLYESVWERLTLDSGSGAYFCGREKEAWSLGPS